jgi:hypothetical protein
MYEKQQWEKVLSAIQRKSESEKHKDFATQILTRYQHLEKEKARQERENKKAPTTRTVTGDKKAVAGSATKNPVGASSLNLGVKRTLDEAVGSTASASAAKKPSMGDGKVPTSAPSVNKPATSSGPTRIRVAGPSNLSDKKSTSSTGISTGSSTGTTTTVAKSKPPTSSGFFKNLNNSAVPSKPQPKYVVLPPVMCETDNC